MKNMSLKKNIIASKDDVVLPKDAEDFLEILDLNTKIINTEFKQSYNKIMVKGDIEACMLYLPDSEEKKVKKFLDCPYMKRVFNYLKRKEYIETFKSIEPTITIGIIGAKYL